MRPVFVARSPQPRGNVIVAMGQEALISTRSPTKSGKTGWSVASGANELIDRSHLIMYIFVHKFQALKLAKSDAYERTAGRDYWVPGVDTSFEQGI